MALFQPPRIIVVDDNTALAELVVTVLRLEGWSACYFSDAPSAIRHLKIERVDIVLLDVELGAESGFEVLRAMRQEGPNSDTPVFMLTASRRGGDKDDARALGASGYIFKPFNIERLARRIDRHLAGREQRSVA